MVLIWKVKLTKRIQILGDAIVVTFADIFLEMYRFILHASLGLISEQIEYFSFTDNKSRRKPF